LDEYEQRIASSQVNVGLDFTEAKSIWRSQAQGAEDMEKKIMSMIYPVMKSLRGTSSYWRRVREDLTRMLLQFGPPTFFVTLSMNDNAHDITRMMNSMCGEGRGSHVREYPVLAARVFHRRFAAFMRYLKRSRVLGRLRDHFWRVEFQLRGSPHIHMLLWVEDDDLPKALRNRGAAFNPQREFSADDWAEVAQFHDQHISCRIPRPGETICGAPYSAELEHLVRSLQQHEHTASCGGHVDATKCRFHFPRVASDTTRRRGPDDTQVPERYILVPKRGDGDVFTNNHNPYILQLWGANMDIQLIVEARQAIEYVAKYVSKAEPVNVQNLVSEVARTMQPGDPRSNLRKGVFAVTHRMLRQREISAQETAWRVLSLPMRQLSRTTVHINLETPGKRKVYIPKQKIDEQGIELAVAELQYKMSDGYVAHKIHHMYAKRSRDQEQCCLFEFARDGLYQTKKRGRDGVGEGEGNDDADNESDASSGESKTVDGSDGDSELQLQRRVRQRLVSFRNFSARADGDAYAYALLLLYVPWRCERDLLILDGQAVSAVVALNARKQSISEWLEQEERGREMMFELEKAMNELAAHGSTDPETDVTGVLSEGAVDVENYEVGDRTCPQTQCPAAAVSEAELGRLVASLNTKQMEFFTMVREWAVLPQGPQLLKFLSGFGGTGSASNSSTFQKWRPSWRRRQGHWKCCPNCWAIPSFERSRGCDKKEELFLSFCFLSIVKKNIAFVQ
jgi:hypothetical protein